MKYRIIGFIFALIVFSSAAGSSSASYINFTGFETGDTSEIAAIAPSAGFTVQSTTKRSGSYAARVNLTTTESHGSVGKILSTTGAHAAMAGGGYYLLYFLSSYWCSSFS